MNSLNFHLGQYELLHLNYIIRIIIICHSNTNLLIKNRIKLKLTPEYINWLEESTENYSKVFYFAVVPIYYDSTNNKYLLSFGSKYDGIEIEYHYDEEKNLVHMNAS